MERVDELTVRGRVRALAAGMAPVPRISILPSDRIVEDLEYDSLFTMALLSEIFDEFDLDLPDVDDYESLANVLTVADLEDVIVGKVVPAREPAPERE